MSTMSDDLISKQLVIDIIEQHKKIVLGEREWHEGIAWGYATAHRHFVDVVKQLPSAQPERKKWIPVSERLPRKDGWYQCTVVVNDLPRTTELFYKNDKWLDNRIICMFNTYDIYGYGYTKEKHKLSYQELIPEFDWTENVVAWMPLPEPWKGE